MPSAIPIVRRALLLLALLASALISGFFYAYSVSVMPGLAATDPLAAARAMQGINTVIRTPPFAFAFFGALLFPLAAALASRGRTAALAAAGGLLYGLGAFAVTFAVNVPLNEGLATAALSAERAPAVWQAYAGPWTAWNHLRALSSAGALGLVLAALAADGQRA